MSKFNKFQIILVSFLVSVSTFYGGYYFGKRGFEVEVKKNPPQVTVHNKFPPNQEVDFALFWEVWNLVSAKHIDRPVQAQRMLYGAIGGMVEALDDPYTSFLPPAVNETLNSSLNGTYQGIGAELGLRDGQLIIVAPLDGSPAKAAGARAGDAILAIEGESTIGITISEAVSKIRGDAGTISNLTVGREGEAPLSLLIKRGVITVKSVTWEDKGDGTAYIRVSRFGTETNKEWSNIVNEIGAGMSELDAIIVDVRGNPGGFLTSAVYLSEEFMRNVPVLYQEEATGKQIPIDAERIGSFEHVPSVIVLIDGGSASASEILAAALKSHIEATIVGSKSFGKGTIQDAKDFSDGSGVHITVAKWLTPEKVWVHKEGITPDVVVERTSEDFNNGVDPQLDKALELADQI